MFRFCRLPIASLTLCALLAVPAAIAQRNNRPKDLAPQWESLFNGKDLTGWKNVGHEKWVVEDGVIHGQGVSKEYGYLATEKSYKDFHLSLRFLCVADGNSGVYIHTTFKEGTPEITEGRQVEIDRTLNHHTGGIYGDGKGWVAWPSPEYETVIRPYDWNDMLIMVEGNHYQVVLNGIKILDFTYPSPGATEGVIALQLHSGGLGDMKFKDIFVKDLSRK